MPLFFLASGYLFREQNLDKSGKYIKRKVKGLWWPFFFWSIAYLFLHNIFAYMHFYPEGYSFIELLKRIPRYAIMAGTEQLLGGF
jgi:fucose 4-O-acetylase-like acetyltransferase